MRPNIHQYFVYPLANARRTVLYTGVTNSLEKRIWQHKTKAIPGFTKRYNCDQLVYFEIFQDVKQAVGREKQIKGWSREKKDALIATTNPEWEDLAADWYDEAALTSGSLAVFAARDDK